MAGIKKKAGTAMTTIQEQIAKQATGLAQTVGAASGAQIRITQGKKFVGPDGVSNPGPINVVIMDHNTQHKYFPNPYDADNPEPPTCFALSEPASLMGRIDQLAPSDNAPEKQAEKCSECPMNQFGTDNRGRGKACKNMRVLAVLSPDAADPQEDEMLLLNVSPTAIKRYDNYVRTLASRGAIPMSVITELSFDEDNDYPSLQFRAIGPNPYLETHWERQKQAHDMLRAEPDLSMADNDAPAKPPRKGKTTKKKASRRRAA